MQALGVEKKRSGAAEEGGGGGKGGFSPSKFSDRSDDDMLPYIN